ncbi:MAG: alpha/beta hydrolase fold domain-containing protein [Akkermansiaceae bacterium]
MSSLSNSLIISTAILFSSCTYVSLAGGDSKFSTKKDVSYSPADWPEPLEATFYQPVSKEPTPAVILIHGGGWNKKERRGDMHGIAKNLAQHGYFVMNTTYRLTPDWKFPAQKKDIDQSLAYLRKNAKSLNIDPNRIATFGYSAGGHLAALTGLDPKNNVSAIVMGGAPSDLSFWPDGRLTGLLLGGPLKGNEPIYREASPVNHVQATSPPVFIYHGDDDTLVPIEHPKAMIKVLEKNNVEHDIYWVEGRDHILTHLFSASAIPKAIDFLDTHLERERSE